MQLGPQHTHMLLADGRPCVSSQQLESNNNFLLTHAACDMHSSDKLNRGEAVRNTPAFRIF
jgi:hypothetical protein